MMLGVSQGQTTVGINFSGGAYAAYASTYGASCYSGWPVTAPAFGITPANWYTSTNGTSVGIPYNYAANGSMVVEQASSINVSWTSPDIWGTHIGFDVAETNSASYLAPPAGNDQVTWAFLDVGSAWSVSMSGLNATFPHGCVLQCIAASGDTGTKVSSSSKVTDGASFTNTFQIYSVDGGFGQVGLQTPAPTGPGDSITLSPIGTCSLCGFILTDKPVVSLPPASVTNNQGSPLVLTCGAIGLAPLSYQWQFNGDPIPGETNASYTNSSIAPANAGSYNVVVTNAYGSTTSEIATVGVNQTPLFETDLSPTTNNAYVGMSTVLSVIAGGAQPLSYQWAINGTPVSGATNAFFTASNLTTGIFGYSVFVTNIYGATNSLTNYLSTVATPDAYTAKVGQDGASSYWPLNETSGLIAYDYSGYGHNGSLSNSATFTLGVAGPQPPAFPGFSAGKTAYEFDGVANFIDCGANASISGTNNFTVEAWINTTSTSGGEIVCQRDGTMNGYIGAYRCYVNANGTLSFLLYGSTGYQFDFSSTKTVNDGNWHQVAFVRNGSLATIYIDGASVASASGTVAALTPTIQTYIGANPRDNNNFFGGEIADVAIYGYALAPGRIVSHFVTASDLPLTVSFVTGGVIQDDKPAGALHDGLNNGTTWLASSTDFNNVTRSGVQQFDETNDTQITIPPSTDFDTTNGTICFWMNYPTPIGGLAGPGSEAAIFFDCRTTGGTIIGLNTAGTIEFQNIYTNNGANYNNTITGADGIDDGNWHHVAITYDQSSNGMISIYVDGVLDTQANTPGPWYWPANQEIELGRSHDAYWKIYNGQMDDFRIYSRILTPTEISTIGTEATSETLIDTNALKVQFDFNSDSALYGKSIVWPYGTLQSSPALGAAAVWTSLTNAVSPQPMPIYQSTPATFYRAAFAP